MKTSELAYDLPEDLIAQHPSSVRDESRLLVVDRKTGLIEEETFRNLPSRLRRGDCLVANDTRVIRARLRARKRTGGEAEVFLLRQLGDRDWEALVRPSARLKPGSRVTIADRAEATIEEALPSGARRVVFDVSDVLGLLERAGEIPLPPYIHREHAEPLDAERYQTVYARHPGAVAAPTAGLHYTRELLDALAAVGIGRSMLTLHVGYGTFRPIQCENLKDHRVEPEEFFLPEETAATLNRARADGGRVVAVGTTSARVLETQHRDGAFRPGRGVTELYIHPPYTFRAVDVLQTNFHLPRSSLLALVCAFGGAALILEAYRYAVKERFRFYSYGDAMLIL